MPASRSMLRKVASVLAALAMCLFFAGSAHAQGDFDFSDDGGGGGGDGGGDFDFSDDSGGDGGGDTGDYDFSTGSDTSPTAESVKVEMPDGSKPIIVAWFDPLPDNDMRVVNRLTESLVESLDEFEDHDAVNGIIIRQDLDKMSADERDGCVYDPVCLSEMGKALKVQKVVVARLMPAVDSDRPRISLELIDVETGGLANLIEYEAATTVKAQQRELRPAAYKLFNKPIPRVGDAKADLTTQADDAPWISTGQLIAVISTGVAGLALIGAGAGIGAGAQSTHDDLISQRDAGTITQKDAQAMLDDANSQATIANVLYGVGGVALVTSVILLLVRPGDEIAEDQPNRSDDDATSDLDFYFNPAVGAEGAGFQAGFTF